VIFVGYVLKPTFLDQIRFILDLEIETIQFVDQFSDIGFFGVQ
jgi:hypothetical protein